MKKHNFNHLIFILSFSFSSVFFWGCSKKACEDIKKADLVIESIEPISKFLGDDGEVVYDIISLISNIASEICDKIIGDFTYTEKVMFKAPGGSEFIEVDEYPVVVSSLSAKKTKCIESEIKFLANGTYRISGQVDSKADVDEIDEENNTEIISETTGKNYKEIVINSVKNPTFDSQGNQIFIEHKFKSE